MPISTEESAPIAEKPLLKRAFEDWKHFTVSGDAKPFAQDLIALHKVDCEEKHLPAQYAADLKRLNDNLSRQSLLPGLEITAVGHGRIFARDQTRHKEVTIIARAGHRVEVEDSDSLRRQAAAAPAISVEKIKAADVRQGIAINDCRFQARLAALAQADPDAIARMIKKNHDGTYTVTFPGAAKKPQRVATPTAWEQITFSDKGAAWTLLIDKAYRQLTKQYFGPQHSAASIEGLLTGKAEALLVFYDGPKCSPKKGAAKRFCPASSIGDLSTQIEQHDRRSFFLPRADVGRVLSDALGRHMTIATFFAINKSTPLTARTALDNANHRVDLESGHYYSLLAYNAVKHTVTLRNPWGKNFETRSHKLVGDGCLEVPLKQFTETTIALDIEKTAKSN